MDPIQYHSIQMLFVYGIVAVIVILVLLLFIYLKISHFMALTQEQFDAAFARIDSSTNRIAGEIRDLKDQIANQGLPGDVEARILATLEAKATSLEAIGKPPTDESESGEDSEA